MSGTNSGATMMNTSSIQMDEGRCIAEFCNLFIQNKEILDDLRKEKKICSYKKNY